MAKLLKIPFWLLSVFSWDKSFRNNPVIGNYWLNRLGLHVLRVALSHALFRFRLLLLSPLVPVEDRREFLRQGFILKRDFLPAEQFAALQRELRDYRGPVRELVEGGTLTQRLFLSQSALVHLPQCRGFTRYPPLDRLLRYASSKNRPPLFYVENLKFHGLAAADSDPQQDFHTDTFHPCVKAWLFMDAVGADNGPHVYVPGSHRLTWKRLCWEYRESLAASRPAARSGGRYWDGSFRVSAEDLRFLAYGEPQALRVPANTLLIGNVHGIHRRGDAAGQTSRMTIWMQARDNPFNPLFTPFPQLAARWFEAVWARRMDARDRKLAEAGRIRFREGGFG